MCKSEWLLDYKEHAFYPNKKTCKACTNRAAMVRHGKKQDKIAEEVNNIMLCFMDGVDEDPEYDDLYLYSVNNFKYVLYKYYNEK